MTKPDRRRSPCIQLCQINADDICMGCYRSVQEINQWYELSDEAFEQVQQLRRLRRKQYNPF